MSFFTGDFNPFCISTFWLYSFSFQFHIRSVHNQLRRLRPSSYTFPSLFARMAGIPIITHRVRIVQFQFYPIACAYGPAPAHLGLAGLHGNQLPRLASPWLYNNLDYSVNFEAFVATLDLHMLMVLIRTVPAWRTLNQADTHPLLFEYLSWPDSFSPALPVPSIRPWVYR